MTLMLTPYQQKASDIIKESIKSAIFIDEQARPFYSRSPASPSLEEKLSQALFNNFKEQGISLSVHKFNKGDDEALKHYFFDNRDLVLLDWKLEGSSGEDIALQMIANIVEQPHLHFCSIYTKEPNTDEIFYNLLSYFSGETEEYYSNLKNDLAGDEEEIKSIISELNEISVYRYDSDSGRLVGKLFKSRKNLVDNIKKAVDTADAKCALIKAGITFQNTFKSKTEQPCPDVISFTDKVLVVNNTIITIINKNKDKDPTELINKLSLQIAKSKNSFTQLLGLEMQNIFSSKGAFIDTNLLDVSKETLLYHRAKLKEVSSDDIPFQELIKSVLIEQAALILKNEDLSLLETALLDNLSNGKVPTPVEDEMVSMNIFYNSARLKKNNRLDFGDVFYCDELSCYFICITALCDAVRPKKIKNRFRFAKGVSINRDKALKLGDTAFISFLNKKEMVVWSEIDNINNDDLHKYRPIYVKPLVYNVPNPNFIDNSIEIKQVLSEEDEVIKALVLRYITTIKQQYAQRIANHAFAHPVRIGVDFVTK